VLRTFTRELNGWIVRLQSTSPNASETINHVIYALNNTFHEVEQAYRDFKDIHDNTPLTFQMGVSEDFGTFGIKAMGFPSHVGWCRAGRQLFAAIPTQEPVLSEDATARRVKIGDVVGCVNTFEPHLGTVVRTVSAPLAGATDAQPAVTYDVEFDHDEIEAFTAKRMSGVYKDGCFATELSEDEFTAAKRRILDT